VATVGSSSIIGNVYKYSATYTSNQTLLVAECLDSTIYISGGTIATLPAVFYGAKVTVIDIDGNAGNGVNPNDNDWIMLDGTTMNNGDAAYTTNNAGDLITCTYYSADGWYCASNGWNDED